jgi:hypothetical protein
MVLRTMTFYISQEPKIIQKVSQTEKQSVRFNEPDILLSVVILTFMATFFFEDLFFQINT